MLGDGAGAWTNELPRPGGLRLVLRLAGPVRYTGKRGRPIGEGRLVEVRRRRPRA